MWWDKEGWLIPLNCREGWNLQAHWDSKGEMSWVLKAISAGSFCTEQLVLHSTSTTKAYSQPVSSANLTGMVTWLEYNRIFHFKEIYNVNLVQLFVLVKKEVKNWFIHLHVNLKIFPVKHQNPCLWECTCVCHIQAKKYITCTFAGFYVCQFQTLKIFNSYSKLLPRRFFFFTVR